MEVPIFKIPTNSLRSELRKRTNEYFKSIKSNPTGNTKLYTKAAIIVTTFIAVYAHLVFFTSEFIVVSIFECVLLGALTAAIGFNIMHDGAHGSFSEKTWVNNLAGMSLNFLGANVFMWKTKHNAIHHTYTNIEGVDDDLNARPFLRLCETQKKYKAHKFQHLYFGLVYSILYIYWVFFTDYKKYFSGKVGIIPIPKMTLTDHLIFWGFKVFHLIAFVLLPIYLVNFTPWLIGFLIYGAATGFILSIVFQLAHVVEETQFPVVDSVSNTTDDDWVVHQLKTTANFAMDSKIVSWFTGGLNYQVEHHLFPNISHIHYPQISKIVQQICTEYNVPYLYHNNLSMAVVSHVKHLKTLGDK